MPDQMKTNTKTIAETLEKGTYASHIDNKMRNDRPYEGNGTNMPPMSPIGNGSVSVKKVK